MSSLEKVPDLSSAFNSAKFLYSIASHTRVLVSVLKTDHKIRRKPSFHNSPTPKNESQLVISSRKLHRAQFEQMLIRPNITTLDLGSAASPNAGSVSRREHIATQAQRSGCCYLCEVDEPQYIHNNHNLPSPPPSPEPLPDSRCIEYHTSGRSTSLQIALDELETSIIPLSLSAPPSRASSRRALAEIDNNVLSITSLPTQLHPPQQKRTKLLPLPLPISPSGSPTRRPASAQAIGSERISAVRDERRRESYADRSFLFGEDEREFSTPRKFARGAKPQAFLLSLPPPPQCRIVNVDGTITEANNGPCPPRRKSSLRFAMRPLMEQCEGRIEGTQSFSMLPYSLGRKPKTLGSPQDSRALSPFSHLSSLAGLHLQSLILISSRDSDPIWTALLQVSTTEGCIRDVCLKAGRVYAERTELRMWCDPVARNIDCSRAVESLNKFLRRGGRQMLMMAEVLLERLGGEMESGREGASDVNMNEMDDEGRWRRRHETNE